MQGRITITTPGVFDASQITSGRLTLARMPDAASGVLQAAGVGVNPAYTTAPTLTNPTIQGTVLAGTGLTMPAFTAGGDISLGANKLTGTNEQYNIGDASHFAKEVFTRAIQGFTSEISTNNQNVNLGTGMLYGANEQYAIGDASHFMLDIFARDLNGFTALHMSAAGCTFQTDGASALLTWSNITHAGIQLTGATNAFGSIVLPTGAGKTVDNVITALQNLGLVTQA
jgi:hypothetical protein